MNKIYNVHPSIFDKVFQSSQGETEIFEEIKFHNMRTQEVLDVVDKLQFEHMGTHINQEPDWSFAKEDNLER